MLGIINRRYDPCEAVAFDEMAPHPAEREVLSSQAEEVRAELRLTLYGVCGIYIYMHAYEQA